MRKANNNDINEAYKWLTNYKVYWQLDDDDIQNIIIRFSRYYDNRSKVITFLKIIVTSYQNTKYKRKMTIKDKHNFQECNFIDNDEISTDTLKFIGTNDTNPEHILIEKENDDEVNKVSTTLIPNLLAKCTPKQRYIIEQVFIQEREQKDVATELKISRQAVSDTIAKGLIKMRKI